MPPSPRCGHVELGPPPVTPLGVVLSTQGQFGPQLAELQHAPGSWCRSSGGTTGEWAFSHREDSLRAEGLLGRLQKLQQVVEHSDEALLTIVYDGSDDEDDDEHTNSFGTPD
ncbi:hypothetical protein NMY22_g11969 [Coprinellus aureogranulatus]|nr:hypothetical protein NMY22_g11969 [Coprinellus aureogranulatus]